jgi:site-specific recombinase XerD
MFNLHFKTKNMQQNKKGPTEIHFTFLCKSSRQFNNGESPIIFRVIYRGQRKDVYTGISIIPQYWMKEERAVSLRFPAANEINYQLHKMRSNAEFIFQKFKFQEDEFTLDDIINQMKGKNPPPQTIAEYNAIKLEEINKRVGVDLAQTTFLRYKRIIRYFNDFLKDKKKMKNIPVSRIDEDFIREFFQYLRLEKGNSQNTASALLGCLKSILKPAIKRKVIKSNPFDQIVLNRKSIDRDFLELEEIKRIQALECTTPEMVIKRDQFLFCCFTGLPYIDLKAFSKKDIVQENDGSLCIRHPRGKTGVMSIIPLLPVAENILKRYSPTDDCRDFQWKVCSNQKLNSGLKQIAIAAEIDKKLFVHLARHTFATTITLSNGVSMESVSKMLGHTTIKHTEIYSKIVAAKVKHEMKRLNELF